ncbi:MAG: hypothetical protein M1818_003816 [Claussenomyces sp. TS43310]|nr:MAG: hypothetical protein M1818_003816 [Claussenomyces sp. TS43310]
MNHEGVNPEASEAAPKGCSSSVAQNEDQKELSKILGMIRHDLTFMGIIALGEDGILRSLTADRHVVDAAALSPRLIEAFLDRMLCDPDARAGYRGTDGRNVPREKWFHPEKSMLPPPLTEEDREASRRHLEQDKDMWEERRKELASREGWSKKNKTGEQFEVNLTL